MYGSVCTATGTPSSPSDMSSSWKQSTCVWSTVVKQPHSPLGSYVCHCKAAGSQGLSRKPRSCRLCKKYPKQLSLHRPSLIEHKTVHVSFRLSFLQQLYPCNLRGQPTLIVGLKKQAADGHHDTDFAAMVASLGIGWLSLST